MRVLLIGASGMLGGPLARELAARFEVKGTAHARAGTALAALDVTDAHAVAARIATEDPHVVVLAAALSSVAACEADPARSRAVNLDGVCHVVEACAPRTLVFFSSDAVFDGSGDEFGEEDATAPTSVYGRHKAEAEALVRALPRHLIVRSARFYARERGSGRFVDHVRGALERSDRVEAPVDTPGNPTFVDDLARAIGELLARERTGTWHLAGPRAYTLYETALAVAEVFGHDPGLVVAVPRDHGSPLPRIGSVLASGKARAEGLRFCDLREGLARIRDGGQRRSSE